MFEEAIALMDQCEAALAEHNERRSEWLRQLRENGQRQRRPRCVTVWHRLSDLEVGRIQRGVTSIAFSLNHNPSLRSTYEKAYEEWGY